MDKKRCAAAGVEITEILVQSLQSLEYFSDRDERYMLMSVVKLHLVNQVPPVCTKN
jgi:hypothetical protein